MWRRVVWYIGTNVSGKRAASIFKVAVCSALNMETPPLVSMSKCPALKKKKLKNDDTGSVSCLFPHPTIDELQACPLQSKDLGYWKNALSRLKLHASLQSVDYLQKVTQQWSTIAISCKTNSRKNCRNLTSHPTTHLCQVFRTYLSESREEFVRKETCFAYY